MGSSRLKTVDERFDAQFKKAGEHDCWEWNGASKNQFGHGAFKLGPRKSKVVYAHRFAWEREHRSEIPAGMVVRHKCDNPKCVNPSHLTLGTQADNIRDKVERGRHLYGELVPHAKLTDECVRKIKSLGHLASAQLAELFNISRQSIADIRAGRTWKHI